MGGKLVSNARTAQGLAWRDEFNLGHDWVDLQHRRLFELVNGLIESCADGSDVTKLKSTLDFLVNYAVLHFEDEESLQIKYNYPDYERHKKLHEDFGATVGELVERFSTSGSSAELSSDVNRVVARWLVNHIQREDKKIGVYIKNLENQPNG